LLAIVQMDLKLPTPKPATRASRRVISLATAPRLRPQTQPNFRPPDPRRNVTSANSQATSPASAPMLMQPPKLPGLRAAIRVDKRGIWLGIVQMLIRRTTTVVARAPRLAIRVERKDIFPKIVARLERAISVVTHARRLATLVERKDISVATVMLLGKLTIHLVPRPATSAVLRGTYPVTAHPSPPRRARVTVVTGVSAISARRRVTYREIAPRTTDQATSRELELMSVV